MADEEEEIIYGGGGADTDVFPEEEIGDAEVEVSEDGELDPLFGGKLEADDY